jgi:hypothetical protein
VPDFDNFFQSRDLCPISGTFNDWQKLRMNRSAKDFVAIVELAEGNHEYKFLVDGEWVNDPNSPVAENGEGNNTIKPMSLLNWGLVFQRFSSLC